MADLPIGGSVAGFSGALRHDSLSLLLSHHKSRSWPFFIFKKGLLESHHDLF